MILGAICFWMNPMDLDQNQTLGFYWEKKIIEKMQLGVSIRDKSSGLLISKTDLKSDALLSSPQVFTESKSVWSYG